MISATRRKSRPRSRPHLHLYPHLYLHRYPRRAKSGGGVPGGPNGIQAVDRTRRLGAAAGHRQAAVPAPRESTPQPTVPAAKPASVPPVAPSVTASVAPSATADAARPVPAAAGQASKTSLDKTSLDKTSLDKTSLDKASLETHQDARDESAQTPLGDWHTEGNKGTVRIDRCGTALCGYSLDPSSNSVGEAVLINMKPKVASEWSGNIYSRASGDTFYGDHDHEGNEFAPGRSLRARQVLLHRERLEPDRRRTGQARDLPADAAGAEVVEFDEFWVESFGSSNHDENRIIRKRPAAGTPRPPGASKIRAPVRSCRARSRRQRRMRDTR